MSIPKKILARQHEITRDYLNALDVHLNDLVEGRVTEMFEIRDFAALLHIHPTHLTNTVKLTTGVHPCHFFEEKVLEIAKTKLRDPKVTIAQVAADLTYDPSNFTKFFKKFAGMTPKEFREQVWAQKTEMLTI